jgi:hypothetical protein
MLRVRMARRQRLAAGSRHVPVVVHVFDGCVAQVADVILVGEHVQLELECQWVLDVEGEEHVRWARRVELV